MKSAFRAAAVTAATIFAILQITQAWGQDSTKPDPLTSASKIEILYKEPSKSKPELRPIYQRLRNAKVLEQLQQFLAPLKLTRNLQVMTADCRGQVYKPYKPGGPVTICYEYVQLIEMAAGEHNWAAVGPSLVTRNMMFVGPFVHEALHDVALAVFDIQQIPIWGGAEFAADNVAAFLMLQFGPDVAMTTVLGSAYFLDQLEKTTSYSLDYVGDIRPTVRQRYYNLLCVAFGSDPVKFANFVPVNRQPQVTDLSSDHADGCIYEYYVLRESFSEAILKPHVNQELLKQVLAMKWLSD